MVDSIAFRNLFTPRVAHADGQATAEDLDKIFAEGGPGMMDREELMEEMMKKGDQSM